MENMMGSFRCEDLKNGNNRHFRAFNAIARRAFLMGLTAIFSFIIISFAVVQTAHAQTNAPANPTDLCTYNWNVWSSGGPDDNPGGGNQRLDPALRVFGVDGSWYSTTIAPGSTQSPLGDNVEPTQITGRNSEWERMYGVGYFPMEPGTVQTINISDGGFF